MLLSNNHLTFTHALQKYRRCMIKNIFWETIIDRIARSDNVAATLCKILFISTQKNDLTIASTIVLHACVNCGRNSNLGS